MSEEERKIRSLLEYTFDKLEEELDDTRGKRGHSPPATGKRREQREVDEREVEEEEREGSKAHS